MYLGVYLVFHGLELLVMHVHCLVSGFPISWKTVMGEGIPMLAANNNLAFRLSLLPN